MTDDLIEHISAHAAFLERSEETWVPSMALNHLVEVLRRLQAREEGPDRRRYAIYGLNLILYLEAIRLEETTPQSIKEALRVTGEETLKAVPDLVKKGSVTLFPGVEQCLL